MKQVDLHTLISNAQDKVIWEQSAYSVKPLINFLIQLVILLWSIYYMDLFNFMLTCFFVNSFGLALFLSATMKYSVFKDFIKFEWGIFNQKVVIIPFDDITAISLVGYKNSHYSTIHFGTNKHYEIKKINFSDAESRVHITFENVKEGELVHELLNLLWKKQ